MRKTNIICLLCALAIFGSASFAKAQTPTLSVREVGIFSYSTPPYVMGTVGGINGSGTIVGSLDDANLLSGFIRDSSGTFTAPLIDPVENELDTVPTAINNSSTICGWYYTSDTGYHGFFYSNGTYTNYDPPEGSSAHLTGINDAGDFAGFYAGIDGTTLGLIVVNGQFNQVAVPGAASTQCVGINNLDQVVGTYVVGHGAHATAHGFMRAVDGTLTYPIDYPGATNTVPEAINDAGLIVGFWTNSQGKTHGFVLQLPSTFVTFDVPTSQGNGTELIGINNLGKISGSFFGRDHVTHGLIARVTMQ
jgi:hypothetical protein